MLDRKGKQVQAQPPQFSQTTTTQLPSNFQSINPLPSKNPFSYAHLQHQSHRGSPSGSSPGSSVELDKPQAHPSLLINYLQNREPEMTPGSQNVTPSVGGDGGKFFLSQLESQTTSGHLTPQSTNLVDRREYGGGGGGGMSGLSTNPGMNALGSERYLNTLQVQQQHQQPTTTRGYHHNSPLSNTNVLGGGGGYPSRYHGYGGNHPSSDNTNHMLPVNIGSVPMGGRTAEVDTGYVPTYTFRTSDHGMNAMDSTGAVGLSLSTGMDAGWLTFMRDCGVMDVREDR